MYYSENFFNVLIIASAVALFIVFAFQLWVFISDIRNKRI